MEAVSEFPFVGELPKCEKSKVAKLWDRLEEMRGLVEKHGVPVPVALAAEMLGVGRQRVYDLIKSGRFIGIEWEGHVFVTEESVIEYAQSERRVGRPLKISDKVGVVVRGGLAGMRAARKK